MHSNHGHNQWSCWYVSGKNNFRKTLTCTVAEDDHLQIFQNYEKLKKQIKIVWKRFRFLNLNLIASTNVF